MTDLKALLETSVSQIIQNSTSSEKLKKIEKIHNSKIHFVPKRYRVLGGILQSMNIQFGNFIEVVIENILRHNSEMEIIEKFSGKKSNSFVLTQKSDSLIDSYITNCQINNYSEKELSDSFNLLIKTVNDYEKNKNLPINTFKHDVDLLFRNKDTGIVYYTEIKYNDDHDTGKFIDINRKFLKTYAYLTRELKTDTPDFDFKPILFYFNNKKMKGNNYLPEHEVIYRGKRFFDCFTNVDYSTLDNYMTGISESRENIALFDNLYNTIMRT